MPLVRKYFASDKVTEIEVYDHKGHAKARVDEIAAQRDPMILVHWWNQDQGDFRVAITHRRKKDQSC